MEITRVSVYSGVSLIFPSFPSLPLVSLSSALAFPSHISIDFIYSSLNVPFLEYVDHGPYLDAPAPAHIAP
jgi:hypothetical protein